MPASSQPKPKERMTIAQEEEWGEGLYRQQSAAAAGTDGDMAELRQRRLDRFNSVPVQSDSGATSIGGSSSKTRTDEDEDQP